MSAPAATSKGSSASDVAGLLRLTLNAVSSEGASVRDRISNLEKAVTQLQTYSRPPAQQEASTQTTQATVATVESAAPAYDELLERVHQLENLMFHGRSAKWQQLQEHALQEEEELEERPTDQTARRNDDSEQHRTIAPASEVPAPYAADSNTAVASAPRLAAVDESSSPRGPATPPPSPHGCFFDMQPSVHVEIPVLEPGATQEPGPSEEVTNLLRMETAPLLARPAAVSPKGLDDAPIVARLARCEELLAQLSAWQASVRKPLHNELGGARKAIKVLADRLEVLGARKMDNETVREWSGNLSLQVASVVSALQAEARSNRDALESRLAKSMTNLIGLKADRHELSQLKSNVPNGSTHSSRLGESLRSSLRDERVSRITEGLVEMQNQLMEKKADKEHVHRLENALLDMQKQRSGWAACRTGMTPVQELLTDTDRLNERLSPGTPMMMGAVAEARNLGLNLLEPGRPMSRPGTAPTSPWSSLRDAKWGSTPSLITTPTQGASTRSLTQQVSTRSLTLTTSASSLSTTPSPLKTGSPYRRPSSASMAKSSRSPGEEGRRSLSVYGSSSWPVPDAVSDAVSQMAGGVRPSSASQARFRSNSIGGTIAVDVKAADTDAASATVGSLRP